MKSIAIISLARLFASSLAAQNPSVAWRSAPEATEVAGKDQLPLPPSAPTPAPYFKPRQVPALLRRLNGLQTCGLYSNGVAYECASTETCGNSGDHFGCCVGQACALSTACLDSTAPACSANTQGLQTLCCNFFSTQPYCVTIISTTGTSSYTDFRCGNIQYASEIQTITALDALSTRSSSTDVNTSQSSDAPGAETTASSSPTGTGTATDTASSSNNSNSGGGSSSNSGAIAGGVVGGIAVIGLIGLGAWFLRKKQNNIKPDAAAAGTGAAYQAVPPGPPGPPHPDMSQPYGGSPQLYAGTSQSVPPGPPRPEMSQPYGGSPQPHAGTPQPYQQAYSPYASTASPAGYPPNTGPTPQTTSAHTATPPGIYTQDQYNSASQSQQGAISEVDGTGRQPAELA